MAIGGLGGSITFELAQASGASQPRCLFFAVRAFLLPFAGLEVILAFVVFACLSARLRSRP